MDIVLSLGASSCVLVVGVGAAAAAANASGAGHAQLFSGQNNSNSNVNNNNTNDISNPQTIFTTTPTSTISSHQSLHNTLNLNNPNNHHFNQYQQQVPSLLSSQQASLSHEENGPILYDEPNRTSAIDDIRSGVIYAFVFTLFFTFFLILPGIRNEKFPTILCIVPSLLVTSIIVISIFGTTWHVGEAPNISAAYKAFSRDRIQGELNVRIGLNSVNISLRAYKYYALHATDGPIIMENTLASSSVGGGGGVGLFSSVSHDLLEREDVFDERGRKPNDHSELFNQHTTLAPRRKRQTKSDSGNFDEPSVWSTSTNDNNKAKIKKLNVDINYNERFYWIEPQQMRMEYHQALERGLPYPILTVVEYLSQDDAGFSWSRQYRSAGYYSSIMLWLSFCVCILMFCLHCATPKYGIYTMQILGLLLLFTNFIYAILVPRGDRELVIPFEGQTLMFRFGWNFWLVMIGGCISLVVGTLIVLVEYFRPNFIFTSVLDVNFDQNFNRSRLRQKCYAISQDEKQLKGNKVDPSQQQVMSYALQRPNHPPFISLKSNTEMSKQLSATTLDATKRNQPTSDFSEIPKPKLSPRNRKKVSVTRYSNQDTIDVRF